MRDRLTYSDRSTWSAPEGYGVAVEQPVEGYYKLRLRQGAVTCGIRIHYGPPLDPVTGEELDRSWRWQAEAGGEYVDFDRVWPACAGTPIEEAEYRRLIRQQEWARQNAPDSAYADPRRKVDLLSTNTPLGF